MLFVSEVGEQAGEVLKDVPSLVEMAPGVI